MTEYSVIIRNKIKVYSKDPEFIAWCKNTSTFSYSVTERDYKSNKLVKKIRTQNVWREDPDGSLVVPVGMYPKIMGKYGQPKQVIDKTHGKETLRAEFTGELFDYQVEPMRQLLQSRNRILVAKTGTGKTVCAAYVIAERKVKTLFIVPTLDLLSQTFTKFNMFLTNAVCGRLGGDWQEFGSDILIATLDSAYNHLEQLKAEEYGLVIVDEAHKEINRYGTVLNGLSPRYRIAMTATPFRFDQMEQYLYLLVSPSETYMEKPEAELPQIVPLNTGISSELPSEMITKNFSRFVNQFYNNQDRLAKVRETVKKCVDAGKQTLVIMPRVENTKDLATDLLAHYNIESIVLTGAVKDRSIVEKFSNKEIRVLIAIDKIADTGLDIPSLDVLINTAIFKDKTKAIQLIGRLNRGTNPKILFDLVDNHSYCVNAFKERQKAYVESV